MNEEFLQQIKQALGAPDSFTQDDLINQWKEFKGYNGDAPEVDSLFKEMAEFSGVEYTPPSIPNQPQTTVDPEFNTQYPEIRARMNLPSDINDEKILQDYADFNNIDFDPSNERQVNNMVAQMRTDLDIQTESSLASSGEWAQAVGEFFTGALRGTIDVVPQFTELFQLHPLSMLKYLPKDKGINKTLDNFQESVDRWLETGPLKRGENIEEVDILDEWREGGLVEIGKSVFENPQWWSSTIAETFGLSAPGIGLAKAGVKLTPKVFKGLKAYDNAIETLGKAAKGEKVAKGALAKARLTKGAAEAATVAAFYEIPLETSQSLQDLYNSDTEVSSGDQLMAVASGALSGYLGAVGDLALYNLLGKKVRAISGDPITQEELKKAVSMTILEGVKKNGLKYIGEKAGDVTIEAVTENLQNLVQDAAAKGNWDPDRPIFDPAKFAETTAISIGLSSLFGIGGSVLDVASLSSSTTESPGGAEWLARRALQKDPSRVTKKIDLNQINQGWFDQEISKRNDLGLDANQITYFVYGENNTYLADVEGIEALRKGLGELQSLNTKLNKKTNEIEVNGETIIFPETSVLNGLENPGTPVDDITGSIIKEGDNFFYIESIDIEEGEAVLRSMTGESFTRLTIPSDPEIVAYPDKVQELATLEQDTSEDVDTVVDSDETTPETIWMEIDGEYQEVSLTSEQSAQINQETDFWVNERRKIEQSSLSPEQQSQHIEDIDVEEEIRKRSIISKPDVDTRQDIFDITKLQGLTDTDRSVALKQLTKDEFTVAEAQDILNAQTVDQLHKISEPKKSFDSLIERLEKITSNSEERQLARQAGVPDNISIEQAKPLIERQRILNDLDSEPYFFEDQVTSNGSPVLSKWSHVDNSWINRIGDNYWEAEKIETDRGTLWIVKRNGKSIGEAYEKLKAAQNAVSDLVAKGAWEAKLPSIKVQHQKQEGHTRVINEDVARKRITEIIGMGIREGDISQDAEGYVPLTDRGVEILEVANDIRSAFLTEAPMEFKPPALREEEQRRVAELLQEDETILDVLTDPELQGEDFNRQSMLERRTEIKRDLSNLGYSNPLYSYNPQNSIELRVYINKDDVTVIPASYINGPVMKYIGPESENDGLFPGRQLPSNPVTKEDLVGRKLYHVTTNLDNVQRTGTLNARSGNDSGGLGGSAPRGVSFTTSREKADSIQRELKRVIEFSKAETSEDRRALIKKYAREDEILFGFDIGSLDPVVTQANSSIFVNEDISSFTTTYLMEREYRTTQLGNMVENPHIIGTDEIFKRLNINDVGVIELDPQGIPDEAYLDQGTDNYLDEIRVYSDVPIHKEAQYKTNTRPHRGRILKSQLESHVNQIQNTWDNPRIAEVVESVTQLPSRVKTDIYRKGAENKVKGVFDPQTKEIFLIAENIATVEEGTLVLLHEAFGHAGIHGVLGSDVAPIMKEIYDTYKDSVYEDGQFRKKKKGETTLFQKMATRKQMDITDPNVQIDLAQELVADLAMYGESPNVLQKLYGKIRDWIRKTFGKHLTITDTDLKYLISKSRDFITEGGDQNITLINFDRPQFSMSDPMFYSRLERTLSESNRWSQSTNPQVVWNKIKGTNHGFKNEELKWSGLENFLMRRKERDLDVSRQDVLDFIKRNQIKVNITTLGDSQHKPEEQESVESKIETIKTSLQSKGIITVFGEGIPVSVKIPDPESGVSDLINIHTIAYSIHEEEIEMSRSLVIERFDEDTYMEIKALSNLAYDLERISALSEGTTESVYAHWKPIREGGENYQEMLFHIPEMVPSMDLANNILRTLNRIQMEGHQIRSGTKLIDEIRKLAKGGTTYRIQEYLTNFADRFTPHMTEEEIRQLEDLEYQLDFYSREGTNAQKHFGRQTPDKSQLLAHARVDTRYAEIGGQERKILFIQELQSDWHQELRDQGASGTITELPEGYKVVFEENYTKTGNRYAVKDPDDMTVGVDYSTKEKAIEEAIKGLNRKAPKDLPYGHNSTSPWYEYVMRRLFHYATSNGYDTIGWTTGEQQISTYSEQLSQLATRIIWERPNREEVERDLRNLQRQLEENSEAQDEVRRRDENRTPRMRELLSRISGEGGNINTLRNFVRNPELAPDQQDSEFIQEVSEFVEIYKRDESELRDLQRQNSKLNDQVIKLEKLVDGKHVAIQVEGQRSFEEVFPLQGEFTLRRQTGTLNDFFGDDLSNRMRSERIGEIEGEDIRIGGAGMVANYNKIYVDTAKSIVKPFKGRVGKTKINKNDPIKIKQVILHKEGKVFNDGVNITFDLIGENNRDVGSLSLRNINESEATIEERIDSLSGQRTKISWRTRQEIHAFDNSQELIDELIKLSNEQSLDEFITDNAGYTSYRKVFDLDFTLEDKVEVWGATIEQGMKDSVNEMMPLFMMQEHQIYADEFKNWFGDWDRHPQEASKVIDENGHPRVVYHGTTGDFNNFGTTKLNAQWQEVTRTDDGIIYRSEPLDFTLFEDNSGKVTVMGPYAGHFPVWDNLEEAHKYIDEHYNNPERPSALDGFYFSESPKIADLHAEISMIEGRENVMPVYLDIRNPFDANDPQSFEIIKPKVQEYVMSEFGVSSLQEIQDLELQEQFNKRVDEFKFYLKEGTWEMLEMVGGLTDYLKEQGFDGVTYAQHRIDPTKPIEEFLERGNPVDRNWIAFSNKQIKSATGNQGSFDSQSGNILYSMDDSYITIEEIQDLIQKELDIPIFSGKKGLGGRSGLYDPATGELRIKKLGDFDTLAEKIGEHIWYNYVKGMMRDMPNSRKQAVYNEIKKITTGKNLTDVRKKKATTKLIKSYLLGTDIDAPVFKQTFSEYVRVNRLEDNLENIRNIIEAYQNQDPLASAKAKVATTKGKHTVENPTDLDLLERIYTKWIDEYYPLYKAMIQFNGGEVPQDINDNFYVLSRLSKAAPGVAEIFIKNRVRTIEGDELGEGLIPTIGIDILQDPEQYNMFSRYAIARRSQELHQQIAEEKRSSDMDVIMNEREIASVVGEVDSAGLLGKFQKRFKKLQSYNKSLLDYAVMEGLLDRETASKIHEMNQNYIPFNRVFSDMGHKKKNRGGLFKRLGSGGKQSIDDPIGHLIDNTFSIVYAVHRNRVYQSLWNQLPQDSNDTNHNLAFWLTKVRNQAKPVTIDIDQVVRQMEKNGATEEDIQLFTDIFEDSSDEAKSGLLTLFSMDYRQNKDDTVVRAMVDGKPQFMRVNDLMWEALDGMGYKEFDPFIKFLSYGAKLLRGGATAYNPLFTLPNFVRDHMTRTIQTNSPYFETIKEVGDPLALVSVAFGDYMKGKFNKDRTLETPDGEFTGEDFNDLYTEFVLGGGYNATISVLDKSFSKSMRGEVEMPSLLGSPIDFVKHNYNPFNLVKHMGHYMRNVNDVVENSSRMAEFKSVYNREYNKLLDEGVDKRNVKRRASLKAGYEARNITIDFSRMGKYMKTINAIVPFSNAAMQGTARFAQTMLKNPLKAMMLTTTYVLVPSMMLAFLNDDNEYYNNQPAYIRDLFWLIPDPTGDIDDNGKMKDFIKVPKPHMWGLFGSASERFLQWMKAEKPAEYQVAKEGFLESIGDQLPINVVAPLTERFQSNPVGGSLSALSNFFMPQLLLPSLEVWTNYNTFRERPIEPHYMRQLLDPEVRYSVTSSKTARNLSRMIANVFGPDGFQLSPRQIDHLVQGYTAGLGRLTVDFLDRAQSTEAGKKVVNFLGGQAEMPDNLTEIESLGSLVDVVQPIARVFTADGNKYAGRVIEDFYGIVDRATRRHETFELFVDKGQIQDAQDYIEEWGDYIALYETDSFGQARNMMNDINGYINDVYNSNDMSNRDKRILLDVLFENKALVAKSYIEGWNNYLDGPIDNE